MIDKNKVEKKIEEIFENKVQQNYYKTVVNNVTNFIVSNKLDIPFDKVISGYVTSDRDHAVISFYDKTGKYIINLKIPASSFSSVNIGIEIKKQR